MNFLEPNGYIVIPNFISNTMASRCLNLAKNLIRSAATEIKVTTEDYIGSTGRWYSDSFITKRIGTVLNEYIRLNIKKKFELDVKINRSNVICKTSSFTDAVPFHQDIPYSPRDPYHFSVWLALTDVDKYTSPLQVIEKSQNEIVEPAKDFWDPYFENKTQMLGKIVSLPVCAGDAIIFSSTLWHGSSKNLSGKERFSYVTRWEIDGEPFPFIPDEQPSKFGMYNCSPLTEKILALSADLFNIEGRDKVKNKDDLIDIWINFLNSSNIMGDKTQTAVRSLKQLKIFSKAYILHKAGNISGEVYKNLWFNLLHELNKKVGVIDMETSKN